MSGRLVPYKHQGQSAASSSSSVAGVAARRYSDPVLEKSQALLRAIEESGGTSLPKLKGGDAVLVAHRAKIAALEAKRRKQNAERLAASAKQMEKKAEREEAKAKKAAERAAIRAEKEKEKKRLIEEGKKVTEGAKVAARRRAAREASERAEPIGLGTSKILKEPRVAKAKPASTRTRYTKEERADALAEFRRLRERYNQEVAHSKVGIRMKFHEEIIKTHRSPLVRQLWSAYAKRQEAVEERAGGRAQARWNKLHGASIAASSV